MLFFTDATFKPKIHLIWSRTGLLQNNFHYVTNDQHIEKACMFCLPCAAPHFLLLAVVYRPSPYVVRPPLKERSTSFCCSYFLKHSLYCSLAYWKKAVMNKNAGVQVVTETVCSNVKCFEEVVSVKSVVCGSRSSWRGTMCSAM